MSNHQLPPLNPNLQPAIPTSKSKASPGDISYLISHISLLCILLIASFLRLSQLPALPPGLNFDEAGSGAAALDILSGSPQLWWQLGGGQEPFWPYLIAVSTAVLGNTPLALRLPAALIGILSVAAVYPLILTLGLGKAMQNRRDSQITALVTVLGLALSGWHLHFSRLGFRAILLPLFSVLAFYFFWRSLKKMYQRATSPWDVSRYSPIASLVLASLFTAFAIYSYLAARLLLFVPVLFLILVWLIAKIRYRLNWPSQTAETLPRAAFVIAPRSFLLLTSYFLLLTFLFLLPLILYFSFNPADFIARSATVSIFNPAWNNGDLIGRAWRTFVITLGTFVGLKGDPNPLVNLSGQPALSPILAPFFIWGLLISLYFAFSPAPLLLRSSASPHLFLLCWWVIMLLPAILAPEGAPHHLRLIGAIVPTYAFVAIGLVAAANFLEKFMSHASHITYLLPATCYLLVAFQTYTNYFIRWPVSADFTLPFDLYAVRLAADVAHAPANTTYILPMDIRAGAEARHYTLDYLWGFQQPRPYTYIPIDEHNAEALLTQAAKDKTELQVVRWTEDKHREADAKEIVTYLLETTATLQNRVAFPVYNLETYALPNPQTVFVLPPITQPIKADFDNLLQINTAFVPPSVAAGDWLPVALSVAPLAPMKADYKASLRLMSPANERIAQKDRILLHNFHQGTSLWPPETVNEYYLLPVPPPTPPGDYTVVVVIYHPDTQAPLVAAGLVEVPVGQVRIE